MAGVTDVLALNQKIREGAFAEYRTGISKTLVTNDTVLAASLSTITSDLDTLDLTTVFIEVQNTGTTATTQNLTAFEVHGSVNGTNFHTLYSTTAEYESPAGILIATSGDLTVTAYNGSYNWMLIDCNGIHSLRFKAQSSSVNTTLTIKYSGR